MANRRFPTKNSQRFKLYLSTKKEVNKLDLSLLRWRSFTIFKRTEFMSKKNKQNQAKIKRHTFTIEIYENRLFLPNTELERQMGYEYAIFHQS